MRTTYRLTIKLPTELVERFRAACDEEGRTLQGGARILIERYLSERATRDQPRAARR